MNEPSYDILAYLDQKFSLDTTSFEVKTSEYQYLRSLINEWKNPITVAVGLLPIWVHPNGTKLLAIVRGNAKEDGYGKTALPGGYVNRGESIEEAVARELQEEIGFKSSPTDWKLSHSRHIKSSNLNIVFCHHRHIIVGDVASSCKLSAEVSKILYVDDTIKIDWSLHHEAVQLFYAAQRSKETSLSFKELEDRFII